MLPSLAPGLNAPDRLPFIKKLLNFLADHRLDTHPVLVVQSAPVEPQQIDVRGPRVQQALLQGSGQHVEGSWWSGFAGGSRKPAFDGYSSVDTNAENPLWAVEVHDDGDILAAVRALAYPDMTGVHSILLGAFSDFAALAERLQAAAGTTGTVRLTATLVNARNLPLISSSGYLGPRPRPIAREVVEWPVLTVATVGDVAAACTQLSARFERMFPGAVL